jgi:hypothetical protein
MGNFSARPNISLELDISKSDSSSLNRSTISWSLRLQENVSQPSYSFNTSTASLSFSLPAGTSLVSGTLTPTIVNYTFDFRASGLQSKVIGTGSFVVQHNASGVGGTISGSSSATADVLGTASDDNSVVLTDYLRLPSAPSTAPTLSRIGKVITITSAESLALSPAGPSITHYIFQYSTNGGTTWTSGGTNIPSTVPRSLAWTAPVFPATYFIRTAAVSTEGTGAYSSSSSIFVSAYGYRFANVGGVPTSTAITTAARYTGVVTDTVVVGGTTYTNWKQIQSVKRYNGTSWIDLVQ